MSFAAPLRHDSRKAVRHCRTAFLFVDLRACRPVYIAVSVMVLPRPAVHVAALGLPAGGCRHPISCLLAVVYGRGDRDRHTAAIGAGMPLTQPCGVWRRGVA